jgi:hypothetical protein
MKYELYKPEEFKQLKESLLKERKSIEDELAEARFKVDRTLELSERTFNFCVYARHHFEYGTIQQKREIFSGIGSNLTLKDGKLKIDALEPYLLIEKSVGALKEKFARLEPEKSGFTKRREAAFAASIPKVLPGLDSNQDTRLQRAMSYH